MKIIEQYQKYNIYIHTCTCKIIFLLIKLINGIYGLLLLSKIFMIIASSELQFREKKKFPGQKVAIASVSLNSLSSEKPFPLLQISTHSTCNWSHILQQAWYIFFLVGGEESEWKISIDHTFYLQLGAYLFHFHGHKVGIVAVDIKVFDGLAVVVVELQVGDGGLGGDQGNR